MLPSLGGMADIVVLILKVVAQIHEIAKEVKETDRQALRLLERLSAIETPLQAVIQGTKLNSSESLNQLLRTVEKAKDFFKEYTQTGRFTRARKRKENADNFKDLGSNLTEGIQALQLDVAVDTWAQQDALDRSEDLEYMMGLLEEMEQNRSGDHNEIMTVLKVNIEDAPVRYIDVQC